MNRAHNMCTFITGRWPL